jgi:hypothetical protein
MSERKPWLKVDSLEELLKHEAEIVKRIEQIPNGGNLFLIHPFMLLADAGVELSENAKKQIISHEPHLSGLSAVPYHALKASKAKQNFRVHLRGLFERKAQK